MIILSIILNINIERKNVESIHACLFINLLTTILVLALTILFYNILKDNPDLAFYLSDFIWISRKEFTAFKYVMRFT